MAGLDPAIHLASGNAPGYVYLLASGRNGTLYLGVTVNPGWEDLSAGLV